HTARCLPLTAADIEALNAFDALAKAPENRLSFFLERGDMIVLNNYTVMHARTEFRNFPEPERQRRLVRLWLDREGFRNVPRELKVFNAYSVPRRQGASGTYD